MPAAHGSVGLAEAATNRLHIEADDWRHASTRNKANSVCINDLDAKRRSKMGQTDAKPVRWPSNIQETFS